ncbi:unnamed protein product [Cuscuta epithymum]|uniref:Uncharacterized protein n=1 Tax=Cuscuta epithymum TaxID=186058 RepID=A0AAV0ERY2_9ASTE|nr:unnamed protein product [Cuscuta epithymum]
MICFFLISSSPSETCNNELPHGRAVANNRGRQSRSINEGVSSKSRSIAGVSSPLSSSASYVFLSSPLLFHRLAGSAAGLAESAVGSVGHRRWQSDIQGRRLTAVKSSQIYDGEDQICTNKGQICSGVVQF